MHPCAVPTHRRVRGGQRRRHPVRSEHLQGGHVLLQRQLRRVRTGQRRLYAEDRLPVSHFLDADLPRFTIYRTAHRVSTREHLRASGVELLSCQRTGSKNAGLLAVHRRACQPVRLGLQLDQRSTLQLNSLAACDETLRLWGVRSVYQTLQ